MPRREPAPRNAGKVLIVARDFVPYCYTFGGVVRMLKLAEFLLAEGFEVFILAAKGEPVDYFGYESLVGSLKVRYVDDVIQVLRNRMLSPKGADVHGALNRKSRLYGGLKAVINEISVPDVGVYLVRRYIREAAGIIRENGIRNVIVTSPPHSTQLVGLGLKKEFRDRINLIVDYRDSWNTTVVTGNVRTLPFQRWSERLERKVLRNADHFTYVSAPILAKLNEKYFDMTGKSTLVMNGFDAAQAPLPAPEGRRNEVLTMGHFGFLMEKERSHRNPAPILKALAGLGGTMKLCLYGTVHIGREWKDRLGDMLEVRDNVPHEEALALMGRMDLLLMLHSEKEGADEVVSGKLFEYMLAQRPILVAGPRGMEAARIVEECGAGYFLDLFDEHALAAGLEALHRKWTRGELVRCSRESVDRYSRQRQYAKILKILR